MRTGRVLASIALLCILAMTVTGSTVMRGESNSQILPAVIDTTGAYDIGRADRVWVFVQYDGDSAKLTVQHSVDGTVWASLSNFTTAQLNGAVDTDAIQYAKELCEEADGTAATAGNCFPVPMAKYLRLILNNDDAADTLKDVIYRVKMVQQ